MVRQLCPEKFIILPINIISANLLNMLEYCSGKTLLFSPDLAHFSDMNAYTQISMKLRKMKLKMHNLYSSLILHLIASSLSIVLVHAIIFELRNKIHQYFRFLPSRHISQSNSTFSHAMHMYTHKIF